MELCDTYVCLAKRDILLVMAVVMEVKAFRVYMFIKWKNFFASWRKYSMLNSFLYILFLFYILCFMIFFSFGAIACLRWRWEESSEAWRDA